VRIIHTLFVFLLLVVGSP